MGQSKGGVVRVGLGGSRGGGRGNGWGDGAKAAKGLDREEVERDAQGLVSRMRNEPAGRPMRVAMVSDAAALNSNALVHLQHTPTKGKKEKPNRHDTTTLHCSTQSHHVARAYTPCSEVWATGNGTSQHALCNTSCIVCEQDKVKGPGRPTTDLHTTTSHRGIGGGLK